MSRFSLDFLWRGILSSRLLVLVFFGFLICLSAPSLGAQIPIQYLPALEAADGTDLGLAVLNSSTTQAQITLTAHTYDGLLITGPGIVNPSTLKVPASAKLELRLAEVFGSGISAQHGWLEVT